MTQQCLGHFPLSQQDEPPSLLHQYSEETQVLVKHWHSISELRKNIHLSVQMIFLPSVYFETRYQNKG